MGTTEFLMAIRTDPDEMQRFLTLITDFIVDWLRYQKECIPTIEGIFILDDIVGFLGEQDFRATALPYLKQIFGCLDVPVRFFHNDAQGLVSREVPQRDRHQSLQLQLRALAGADEGAGPAAR